MLLKWGCTPAHWLIAYCSKGECDVWWKWRWGAAQVILALFQGGSDESLRHKPLTNPTVLPSCCVNVSPIMTSQKICAVFPTGAFLRTHTYAPSRLSSGCFGLQTGCMKGHVHVYDTLFLRLVSIYIPLGCLNMLVWKRKHLSISQHLKDGIPSNDF